MAEERPAEAARRRPAIELEAGYNDAGWHYANIRIDSPYLAAGILGVVTLGALYYRNPEGVETVVSNAFRGIVWLNTTLFSAGFLSLIASLAEDQAGWFLQGLNSPGHKHRF